MLWRDSVGLLNYLQHGMMFNDFIRRKKCLEESHLMIKHFSLFQVHLFKHIFASSTLRRLSFSQTFFSFVLLGG